MLLQVCESCDRQFRRDFGAIFSCFLGAGNGWPVFSSCFCCFLGAATFRIIKPSEALGPPSEALVLATFRLTGLFFNWKLILPGIIPK